MATREIKICDLCEMDGEETTAIAKYKDVEGNEWDICTKHLEKVKKVGLPYLLLE